MNKFFLCAPTKVRSPSFCGQDDLVSRYASLSGFTLRSNFCFDFAPAVGLCGWGQRQIPKGRDKLCQMCEVPHFVRDKLQKFSKMSRYAAG